MDLKDFVGETLKQIIDGVITAQQHAGQAGAAVNPDKLFTSEAAPGQMFVGHNALPANAVDFDVLVSTAQDDKAKGGVGLFVGPIGVGAQGEAGSASSTSNRIKFSVPILLPRQ